MENYGSCTGLKKSTHLFFRNVLSKGLATKADEFSEKCQGGGVIFNPNKTIGDEGITVDFRFIKVHTSN